MGVRGSSSQRSAATRTRRLVIDDDGAAGRWTGWSVGNGRGFGFRVLGLSSFCPTGQSESYVVVM
jgi:hypothetical protein